MRLSPSTIVTQPQYRGFSVNAGPLTPCYKKPLDRIIDRFESITSRFPSVMFFFITLKFQQKTDYELGNSCMVRTMNSLVRHLDDHGLPHEYLWVPEMSSDGGIHIHLVLVVATNWSTAFHVIIGKFKEYWANALDIDNADGLIDYSPSDNGTIMRQGAPDFIQTLNACVCHASYLAKVNTKCLLPPHCRGFGASHLPRAGPTIM